MDETKSLLLESTAGSTRMETATAYPSRAAGIESGAETEGRKRLAPDRRRKPTNPFSLSAFKGRRRTIRRKEDRWKNPYVDNYSPWLFLFCMFFLLLIVADGLFTVMHVSRGTAREANPLMASLLNLGNYQFFIVKYVLSSLCLLLLVVYRHVPVVLFVFVGLSMAYVALFIFHIYHFFL